MKIRFEKDGETHERDVIEVVGTHYYVSYEEKRKLYIPKEVATVVRKRVKRTKR